MIVGNDLFLSRTPFGRGFWTDAEMMEATGATSLIVTKTMQAKGLVRAGRFRNEQDRYARSWQFEDLLKIAAVVDFAHVSAFSLTASAEILAALPESELDAGLSLKTSASEIERFVKERVALEIAAKGGFGFPDPLPVPRSDAIRITIIDRDYVFVRKAGEKPSIYLVGRLHDTGRGPTPQMDRIAVNRKADWTYDGFPGAQSVLDVYLSRLSTRPFQIGDWCLADFNFEREVRARTIE